jgi:hypothetical protein
MSHLHLIVPADEPSHEDLLREIQRLQDLTERFRRVANAAIDWRTASTGELARAAQQPLAAAVDALIRQTIAEAIAIGNTWEREAQNDLDAV